MVVAIVSVLVGVNAFVGTVIRGTSSFAFLPVNVTVIVPMPAVIVPTAVVTPLAPIFVRASKAASIFATRVALVALHAIEDVVRPKLSVNVPPVIPLPNVSVWISLVPLLGAAADISRVARGNWSVPATATEQAKTREQIVARNVFMAACRSNSQIDVNSFFASPQVRSNHAVALREGGSTHIETAAFLTFAHHLSLFQP